MSNTTNIKTQLIAGFLAVLFLVVTTVKFFHTCDHKGFTSHENNVAHVSETASCAICEFHLTKDADFHMQACFSDIPAFYVPQTFVPFAISFQSSIGLSFSDRGPPSML